MTYRFLSLKFYTDYPKHLFPEIERKQDRPYIMICININNYMFALPLRSHISHHYAYFTDKKNACGVDYTKAVYISNPDYIDKHRKPHIRPDEFNFLRGKEYIIQQGFIKYLEDYIKAQNSLDIIRMQRFSFSTLHYFESLIDYDKDIIQPLKKKQMTTI